MHEKRRLKFTFPRLLGNWESVRLRTYSPDVGTRKYLDSEQKYLG